MTPKKLQSDPFFITTSRAFTAFQSTKSRIDSNTLYVATRTSQKLVKHEDLKLSIHQVWLLHVRERARPLTVSLEDEVDVIPMATVAVEMAEMSAT